MTIQERLRRSNLIMLIVPAALAGVLLAAGLGGGVWLLQAVYLPRLGLTLQDLHTVGEQVEDVFSGLKLLIVLYAAVVVVALVAAVVFTNLYLTRALFAHIRQPLDTLVQGVQRIRDGDLETPIAYSNADEFRPACDAVDEMAARLKTSLAAQQQEQQKKQELIAGMSHDLKSPLAAIRAYTEALLEGVAPDEAVRQRYLQTIYARETDLEALVNRLFELAKLNTGEYPVQLRPLILPDTLQEILASTEDEALTVTLNAAPCTVQADRELLTRILHNLLDNSRKYGATAVALRATVQNGAVILTVTDNGPGVPDTQLPHLFEPFYRGDAARTQPCTGSGLGLAVVDQLVRKMDGRVTAENTPGGGLCVTLTLPLAKE